MLGLLLVDHGSRRGASNQQLEEMAERIRRLRPKDVVAVAHMEIAAPDIAFAIEQLAAAGVTEVRVLPYFLSDGKHITVDVPKLVEAACARCPGMTWQVGAALGPDDALARLLLQRCGLAPG